MGEVLLLECKTREQDAIVMSNNEGGEVVLKLGDIKKCFVVKAIHNFQSPLLKGIISPGDKIPIKYIESTGIRSPLK